MSIHDDLSEQPLIVALKKDSSNGQPSAMTRKCAMRIQLPVFICIKTSRSIYLILCL